MSKPFLVKMLFLISLSSAAQQCLWQGKRYWQGNRVNDSNGNTYQCRCTNPSQLDPSTCLTWSMVLIASNSKSNPVPSVPSTQTKSNFDAEIESIRIKIDELRKDILTIASDDKRRLLAIANQFDRRIDKIQFDAFSNNVTVNRNCYFSSQAIANVSDYNFPGDYVLGHANLCDPSICEIQIPIGWAVKYSGELKQKSGQIKRIPKSSDWNYSDANLTISMSKEFGVTLEELKDVQRLCITIRPIPKANSREVIIYESANLEGAYKVLQPGKYKLNEFNFERIGSIALSVGSKIEFFADEKFETILHSIQEKTFFGRGDMVQKEIDKNFPSSRIQNIDLYERPKSIIVY